MWTTLPLLIAAASSHAYWYPNSYTRKPSPDEDCYSQADDPYSITCHATNDFVYAPCSDLYIPSTPARPNNFTYYAICTFPDPHRYDEGDFWSDIITVDVCEKYWDACISDNVLAKYDETIVYGVTECRKVTEKACGPHREDQETIPGSEPEDTTLGAFNLGPYSTVSQVTVPRSQVARTSTSGMFPTSAISVTQTPTLIMSPSSQESVSNTVPSAEASKTTATNEAGEAEINILAIAAGIICLYISVIFVL